VGATATRSPRAARRLLRARTFATPNAILLAAIALALVFSLSAPYFATLANAENIARQTAPTLLLGLGMMLVVLVGGIDLSVGSTVLAAATLAGIASIQGYSQPAPLLAALGAGAAVGTLNALLVEGLRVSPVIATLGTMIAIRGLALVTLQRFGSWVEPEGKLFDVLASGRILGLPLDTLLALVAAGVIAVLLRATLVGRWLRAAGDNAVAARLAGIAVRRARAAAYVLCGGFAGVAGLLIAARTAVVSPSIGVGLEFFAVAVVALGAGGLPAGRVGVRDTLIGAVILMMVFNYMTIRGVRGDWQTTATGFLLLAAVMVGRLIEGRSRDGTAHEAGLEAELFAPVKAPARLTVALATLVLVAIFSLLNPSFASAANVLALIEQNAALGIVAIGAMCGIISRTIDISSGSVVALGAVAAALALSAGAPMPLAIVLGSCACLLVYAFNGLIAGMLGLDPLLVTLAAWIWARGLAISLTGAQTLPFDPVYVAFMNAPILHAITPAVVLLALAFLAAAILLKRLPFGARLKALGADPRMLRQAGVDDRHVRIVVMVVMGAFTAAGMLVMLGRLGAAAPTAGFGLELDAIVAVIIGGASFRGGAGRLRDTAVGVLFLAILNNGLSTMQMGDAQFLLAKGSAILLALALRSAAGRYFEGNK
jgi:ribose/xylose/arabinose/galactoside ABC-type transport system permease subunit